MSATSAKRGWTKKGAFENLNFINAQLGEIVKVFLGREQVAQHLDCVHDVHPDHRDSGRYLGFRVKQPQLYCREYKPFLSSVF